MIDPSQQVAVVTGASGGIGEATAKALARAGYTVALIARRAEALETIREHIQSAGGHAHVYPCDASDAEAVGSTCGAIINDHGLPEILVNNAGVGRWLSVCETESHEAVEMMAVPYFAAFYFTRALLPAMLERGSGHLLHVTSPAGFVPIPGAAGYSAARWAMRGFHESLWAELRGSGVSSTLVVPAKVDTPYFENNPGAEARIPSIAKLMGTRTPEEVAQGIVRALRRRPKVVLMPFMLRAFMWMQRLLPGAVDWLVACTGWKRRAS